mmetsp:Transcript_31532/g.62822  ORF Transcript_31532/g.62822 Transcript_31532/m.62822 type:complete len:104 (+) Transcript_31532:1288-1599(+)
MIRKLFGNTEQRRGRCDDRVRKGAQNQRPGRSSVFGGNIQDSSQSRWFRTVLTSTHHVLKGVEAGTNAEAEDASSAIDAMERTFMVETRIYYRNFEVMTTKRV